MGSNSTFLLLYVIPNNLGVLNFVLWVYGTVAQYLFHTVTEI